MKTQENLLARRLKHRNIVAATEMPDGDSLRKVLDAGPLPIARAIRLAHDIASGLAHAHLEGVVHGSLTLSSIIVTRSGTAKITDFGGGPADHRSDIFALGALFYEMLTRRPPVEGGSPPPPSELNPHVPRALDAIVLSMLAAQPADRMPGVPVLLRALERIEEGLGLEPVASAAPDEPAASVPPAAPEPADHDEFDYRRVMMEREREAERNRVSASRIETLASVGVVLAVLGIGVAGFMYYYSSTSGKRDLAARRMQEAPAVASPTAPPAVAEATKAPEPLPAKSVATERIPLAQSDAPAGSGLTVPPSMAPAPKEKPAPLPQTEELPRIKQPAAKVAAQQPRATAQLILAVSPGGDVYIDGEHHGTTTSTTTFDLAPGMHHIEVRSGSRKPFTTYMTVEPGDVRRIRHDFDAKPSSPPA